MSYLQGGDPWATIPTVATTMGGGFAGVGGQLQAVTRFRVTIRRSPRVPVTSVGSWPKGFRAERSHRGSSELSLEALGT